jgi:hypothetical protein
MPVLDRVVEPAAEAGGERAVVDEELVLEHVRQRFFELELDLLPGVPVATEVVAVKGAQSADRLVEGAGLELAPVLEVDEEVEHGLGLEFRQMASRIVGGELADPAVVGHAGALGESFELDKPGEVLIPRG